MWQKTNRDRAYDSKHKLSLCLPVFLLLSVTIWSTVCKSSQLCSKWTIQHYISIRQTFNEKKHTLSRHARTHKRTQNNPASSPPQIILSNSSLTPAVREHFPRVRSHNQTTEGDQSTRKTKLTKRSLSLSALLSHSLCFTWRPKVLCHLLATFENTFFSINKRPQTSLSSLFHWSCWLIFSFSVIPSLSNTFALLLLYTCRNNKMTKPSLAGCYLPLNRIVYVFLWCFIMLFFGESTFQCHALFPTVFIHNPDKL